MRLVTFSAVPCHTVNKIHNFLIESMTPFLNGDPPDIGLYMGKNDLGTLPLFLVGTWTLLIFHTQKVTLIFSLKHDT